MTSSFPFCRKFGLVTADPLKPFCHRDDDHNNKYHDYCHDNHLNDDHLNYCHRHHDYHDHDNTNHNDYLNDLNYHNYALNHYNHLNNNYYDLNHHLNHLNTNYLNYNNNNNHFKPLKPFRRGSFWIQCSLLRQRTPLNHFTERPVIKHFPGLPLPLFLVNWWKSKGMLSAIKVSWNQDFSQITSPKRSLPL